MSVHSVGRLWLSSMIARVAVAVLLFVIGAQSAVGERKTTYYHVDVLGSVVAASDQSGQLLWSKEYAPFGEQLDSTAEQEELAFTGKEHDDLTGLTYFGARYYDPYLGRFMSVDPAGINPNDPFTFNRYSYGNNNPYRFIDPDGRQSVDTSCDEVCEEVRASQERARPAAIVAEKASQIGDIGDQEARDPWNWVPGLGAAKKAMLIWTATKKQSRLTNALRHFKDHGADFGAKNALDYVKQAQKFLKTPPTGTLSKIRANGDVVRYHPATNTFGVMDKDGAPRTFYKLDPAKHGYSTNLDYFNAQ